MKPSSRKAMRASAKKMFQRREVALAQIAQSLESNVVLAAILLSIVGRFVDNAAEEQFVFAARK